MAALAAPPVAMMVSVADLKEMLAPMLKETLAPMVKETLAPMLKEMLAPMVEETLAPILKEALAPLLKRLDEIAATVSMLKAEHSNENVRRYNSVRPVGAPLAPLPFTYEGKPWPQGVQQPARMLDLAVSGAEQLPGGGGRPNWNRGMSRSFLKHAVAQLPDDSDGEDEGSSQSRTSRLRVVQLMGGSFERVIGAVFALH